MASRKAKRKQRTGRGQRRQRRAEVPVAEEMAFPDVLPVLPARDLVAFPSVMMSLQVGRSPSVRAVEEAVQGDRLVFVVAQQNIETDTPQPKDLYQVGVIAHIIRTLKQGDGRYKILLQGIARARVTGLVQVEPFLRAEVEPLPQVKVARLQPRDLAVMKRIRDHLQILVEREAIPEEMILVSEEVEDPGILADIILAHYKLDTAYAQSVLEEIDPLKRLRLTDSIIADDLNKHLISQRIEEQAQVELSKGQREYYLREQIKQIRRELGESDDTNEELTQLREAIERAGMSKQAHEEALRQLKRLERMHQESGEWPLIRTYLEWMVDLPWNKRTKDTLDLKRARRVLDRDHDGLEKVKERILEYLSVRKLNPDSRGSILCLVGPPGVGKTSLGRSIAGALGRSFYRMSLGGMRDEAEIRGHRRTYVGALPGRIIQGMKQAGSKNPVFVLDELDKLGSDFRGDPASALLEVLDPAQNKEFCDHYLNVEYDLSEVLFIATANTTDTIPEALLDRLEVIHLSGYTTAEKVRIAKRFLVPRQMKENGLMKRPLSVDTEAISLVIERYTREAGVRNLERELGSLLRKVAHEQASGRRGPSRITSAIVGKLLGPTKYDPDPNDLVDTVGLVKGLAWTAHGGELMHIEASIAKGAGTLNLTGQLGSVMQESAKAAMFFTRACASELGFDSALFQQSDIHIHVPAGATPKDGPSAGITICVALVSAFSNRKVAGDVAMTGEITLRGSVLAVGGLKEKALAALRYGIKRIIIPFDNVKDLDEIPKEQRQKIQFFPVKHVREVLALALRPQPKISPVKGHRRGVKPAITVSTTA